MTINDLEATEARSILAEGVRPSLDGERIIAVLSGLVEPLGRSLPSSTEVVLHDLSRLPNSIVAIHGSVTGRHVGSPATDLLLEKLQQLSEDIDVGYETHLPDGRRIRSSTMIVRDVAGSPVAAMCVNSDLSPWESLAQIAVSMTGALGTAIMAPVPLQPPPAALDGAGSLSLGEREVFATDVDQLASHLLRRALVEVGVPVELMRKRHKVAIVRDLKSRGMFQLRDAVDLVAGALQVTRFTIYNYLNEIADNDADPAGERKDRS